MFVACVGEGFALPQANLLHTVKSTEGARTVSTTDTVGKPLLREGKALPYNGLTDFFAVVDSIKHGSRVAAAPRHRPTVG